MSGYTLSRAAEDDIFEIWNYMALQAELRVAEQIEARIFAVFGALVRKAEIEVVGVLHDKRNIEGLLCDRLS